MAATTKHLVVLTLSLGLLASTHTIAATDPAAHYPQAAMPAADGMDMDDMSSMDRGQEVATPPAAAEQKVHVHADSNEHVHH